MQRARKEADRDSSRCSFVFYASFFSLPEISSEDPLLIFCCGYYFFCVIFPNPRGNLRYGMMGIAEVGAVLEQKG